MLILAKTISGTGYRGGGTLRCAGEPASGIFERNIDGRVPYFTRMVRSDFVGPEPYDVKA